MPESHSNGEGIKSNDIGFVNMPHSTLQVLLTYGQKISALPFDDSRKQAESRPLLADLLRSKLKAEHVVVCGESATFGWKARTRFIGHPTAVILKCELGRSTTHFRKSEEGVD